MIGTKIAHYEITAHLGSGGMGDVYRATDTKLNRSVAIKLLPAAFASDAERLLRFGREAQMLAALNHPNIAQIYGIEETGDTRCIVMELVQGETLQERIKRGPLPLDEALTITKEIAVALEAAHDKGVIHRDLKPGNVMLTGDGKIKVLDFGLAKASDANASNPNLSNSPTMMSMATNIGVILGTAAYMSPEQAKGRAVDRRTDIFALGCILYEMLTGKRAFDGDDVTDILSAVLRIEPDWTQLPASTPADVRELLRLYLEKNPKNRRSDATDVRLDIERVFKTPATSAEKPTEVVVKTPRWKLAVLVVTALVIGFVTAGAVIWKLRPVPAALPVARFTVTLPEGQVFTNPGRTVIAISPDGSQMIYVANQRLYHRVMSELEARPIPGTESFQGVLNPIFSPDGRSVVFFALSDRTLKKIAVTGGATVTLCPVETNLFGLSWGNDGIVFGQGNKGILRVSENGGKPELLVNVESGEFGEGPQVLPGGEALMFTVSPSADDWDHGKVFVQSLKPGSQRKLLIDGGSDARYVPTGHIIYAYRGSLFAVPFDLNRLQVTGGQVPVLEGVRRGGGSGSAQFSFSDTGSLIYISGPVLAGGAVDRTLAFLDRRAGVERLKIPPKAYSFPRLSPDRKRVAVSTDDKEANVWIIELAGDTAPRQLTLGGANRYPVWSADGQWVAFQSDREGDLGIFRQKADGTGTAERLTKPEKGIAHIPDSWHPDGNKFSYTAVKGSEAGVYIFSLQDKKSTVFIEKAGTFFGRSAFSPDGQWLAYQTNEAGGAPGDVFVQPFPSTGAKYSVVKGGHPFWSPDGREIGYNPAAGAIGVVSITTRPTFSFGQPTLLPGGASGLQSKNPTLEPRVWDFAPDGKRLLGVAVTGNDTLFAGQPQIQVVLNWFSDLQQHFPVK